MIRALAASGLAILHSACDRPADKETAPSPVNRAGADIPLLKIQPGDFWRYRVKIEMPAGATGEHSAAVSTTHERVRTFLGKVTLLKDAPEVECFEVVSPNTPVTREYVAIHDDRVELKGELMMKDADSKPLVFPEPVVFVRAGMMAGDSLELPAVVGPGRRRSGAVIAREECKVPAGLFPSILLLHGGLDGEIETRRNIWFSPGNGIVKEERVRYAKGKVIVRETHELIEKGHRALDEKPAPEGPR